MASNNSTAKTHVSLRLPTYLLESIDAHAERESISRTEAFVHYLQTGLELSDEKANEPSADEAMLMNIQAELAEIKAMLKAGGASVPADFDAAAAVGTAAVETVEAEEEVMVPVSFMSEEEDDEEEVASEFTTSDAVYTSSVEEVEVEDDEDEEEAAAPVANVFSPNYQPAAVADVEEAEIVEVSEDDDSMETLSDYYNETAAEAEAEEDFTEGAEDETASMFDASDAVASPDEMPVEEVDEEIEESNPYVSSSYFSTADEDEDEAEEEADEFDDSDAVFESSSEAEDEDYSDDDDDDDELEEEIDMFDASDEVIDPEDTDDEGDELNIDEVVYVEPLALSDLEDAVALVAQQFPMIEKVWLFGNAATGGAIQQDTIDLCVKADKFKSKYADLFVSMIEDNTGRTANVVLRSEMEKSVKQIWKATRIDLYRA